MLLSLGFLYILDIVSSSVIIKKGGDFLKINDIFQARKSFIDKYVNKKYKNFNSPKELKKIKESLFNKMLDGKIVTSEYEENSIVNYNNNVSNNIKEMFFDIGSVYEYINETDSSLSSNLDSSYSVVSKIESDISKANETIDEYQDYIKSKGNPINKIESFYNKNNFETSPKFYLERYGESVDLFSSNVYEESTSSLILPKLRTQNMAYYSEGVIAANAYINRQFSSDHKKETNSDSIKNILIPNSKNGWEENIYTVEPIKLPEKTKHYEINSGALCEIVISFESTTVLNEIKILPYSKYPVDILEIRYSSTGALDENTKWLVTNLNSEKTLKPTSLDKPVIYRFPNILVKNIYITLNQLHYIRNIFLYNESSFLKNKSLYSFENKEEMNNLVHKDYKPLESKMSCKEVDKILSILQKSYLGGKIYPENISFDQNTSSNKTIKCHYNYGIKTIIPSLNEFDKIGMYVSKPISGVGNIRSVSINTEEEHMLSLSGQVVSDIEYYLTCSENPKWQDWIPILPINKTYIKSELIQMYNDLCYLRFPGQVFSVTCDDSLLNKDIDYFEKKDTDGNTYAIEIPDYDFTSLYSVEYKPDAKSHIVDFSNNKRITTTEHFDGNDSAYFVLNNTTHSFKDSEKDTGTYIKIIDCDTGKVTSYESNGVTCVTDLHNQYSSYKNFDKANSDFQYYTYQNYLYFNKPIPKSHKVEVTYKHFVNKIRLKSIIRRNTKSDKHITPVLNSIEYNITTTN